MLKKAVLFDLDGTLLHTLPDLTAGVNHVRDIYDLPELTEDMIRSYIGDGLFMLIKRSIHPNTTDDINKGVAKFREYYLRNMLAKTKPYKGIPELLKQLRKDNMLLGVVTNKPQPEAQKLCDYFFNGFDLVIGSREGMKVKPDTAMISLAIEKLKPEQVVYVGDSDVDVFTGKNANIPCVAVTWGYRTKEQLKDAGAEYFASTGEELYKLIYEIFNRFVQNDEN